MQWENNQCIKIFSVQTKWAQCFCFFTWIRPSSADTVCALTSTRSCISSHCLPVPILCNYTNYSKLMALTERCPGPLHLRVLQNTITTCRSSQSGPAHTAGDSLRVCVPVSVFRAGGQSWESRLAKKSCPRLPFAEEVEFIGWAKKKPNQTKKNWQYLLDYVISHK